jgi:CRP-like cAMP-binding protein
MAQVDMGRTIPPVNSVTRLRPVADRELIKATELFAELDDEALDRVLAEAKTLDLRRGDVLFEEGAEPDHLYVVEDGRIAMASKSDDGRESVFALMEPGDLFGEMPLLDGLGRSAEARALEPSIVVQIPYGPVHEVFQERPDLLWGVVRLLSLRLRNMDAALADSVFLDVTGRTAKRLLDMSDGEDEFTLPVTQEELAGMVGASRERVNKAIASFVRLGWIDQTDRRYTILDREQLTRRASQ